MTLETRAEEIRLPLAASNENIRYARTPVGSGDFLLPQYDELTITDLEGKENRTVTRFTACRQYTSHSSVSFDTESDAAPAPRGKPAPQEKTKQIELPAGIALDLKLETPIRFGESAVGDPLTARLNRPIHAGAISVPKGATVSGRIRALEQYYEPRKLFVVSLEFSSLTFDGGRAVFRARLIGPRLEEQTYLGDTLGTGPARSETRGLDIDGSSQRFGVFRVPGASLYLERGTRLIWETQGGKP